VFKNIKLSEGT